jgi:hypothetical protein
MPVYQYDGQHYDLPEGLSNEQAIAKIKSHLGQPTTATPSTPAVTTEQPKRSMAEEAVRQVGLTGRAAYEAFTSPATAVLEGISGAYNLGAKALGSESRMPSFAGEQSKMLSSVLPTPENATERAVQSGVQAMTSTAGLAKAAPNVAALSADMARQIPVAGISGLAAQPAAEFVKDATGSDLAATIAGIGVGTITAAGAGKALAGLETGKQPIYTMKQVKERAAQSYTAVDNAGVTLKPDSVRGMITNIRQGLDDARMVPGTDQADAVTLRLAEMEKVLGNNKELSFSSLDKMRSMLNDLKGSSDRDISRLGNVAVSKVDDYISNLGAGDIIAGKEGINQAVKTIMAARKDWRNASRAEMLDDALNTAEARALDPKASESELIRRGFINIAANKDKLKLFNETEQNVIKSVAKGGTLDPLLSIAARFSPLRSQLAAAGGAAVYTQSPTAAIALSGGGLAADLTQGFLRSRAAKSAINRIASGAQPDAPNLAYRGLLSETLNPPTLQPESQTGLMNAPVEPVSESTRKAVSDSVPEVRIKPATRFDTQHPIAQKIAQEADRQGLGEFKDILMRQAYQESRFDPMARSKKNARGIMQIVPGTARDLGLKDPYNPDENIRAGVEYMGQLLKRYNYDVKKALAAYNYGMGRVDKQGLTRLPKETRDYLNKILQE